MSKVCSYWVNKCSQPGVLYDRCKVHQVVTEGIPLFRYILSTSNTPAYCLAKFFVHVLSNLTKTKFILKDSFEFAADIRKQNADLFMASFDIDSLCTNIPLEETIVWKTLSGEKRHLKDLPELNSKHYWNLPQKIPLFYLMVIIMNKLTASQWAIPKDLRLPICSFTIGKKSGEKSVPTNLNTYIINGIWMTLFPIFYQRPHQ